MGNSGRVERVSDAAQTQSGAPQRQNHAHPAQSSAPQRQNSARKSGAPQRQKPAQPTAPPRPVPGPAPGERRPPSPLFGLSGDLGKILRRLSPAGLETEDLLVIVILYLLYRESGDEEFLIAIGGYILF